MGIKRVYLPNNHVFYAVSTHEFFCTIELRSNSLHPSSTFNLQPSSISRQSQITRSQIHRSQETIFFYGRTNHSRGGGEATGAGSATDRATRCAASENACVHASENTSLRLDIATARAGSEDACVRCAASAEQREKERKNPCVFLR